MPIPAQYKGHKKYAFVHVHNGVATTLVDLDDDPDTITFEVDRFSTFVLMYSDEETPDLSDYATLDISDGVLTAISTTEATLYVASYDETGRISEVQSMPVYESTPVEIDVVSGQRIFVFDKYLSPLCKKLVVE